MSAGCLAKMDQPLSLQAGQTRVGAGRTLERLCSRASQDVIVTYTTVHACSVASVVSDSVQPCGL